MKFDQPTLFEAYRKLPEPVRAYLLSEQFTADIQAIGQKFGLHVDTIGVLSLNTGYMLCGLVTPTEILGELVSHDADAQTAKAVVAELNTKIFKPLQDRVRSGPTTESPQPEEDDSDTPVAPAAVAPAAAPVAPRPVMAVPAVTLSAPPVPPAQPIPVPVPRPIQPPTPRMMPAPPVPTNLPGVMDGPKPPATPLSNKEALHEVLKSYGVDPYREEPE